MSASEVELRCPLGFALGAMSGAVVELELLDEPGGSWVPLRGHVTHVRPGTHSLVIHIDDIPAPLEALIDAHLAGQRAAANDTRLPDDGAELPSGHVTRE